MKLTRNTKYKNRPAETGVTFGSCIDIPLTLIRSKHRSKQPRRSVLNPNHVQDLESHINSNGLFYPIVVSVDSNGLYFLEGGHHRKKAAENLGWKTIPCYPAEFEDHACRLKFQQGDNNHAPAMPHKQEDAVKLLQDLKDAEFFKGFTLDEQKEIAMDWLKEDYSHLNGHKRNAVWESYLRKEGELQYIIHTEASRKKFASKHGFHVDSGKYDLENNRWFVCADTGNAAKLLSTINSYQKMPAEATEAKMTAFVYTRGKTKGQIKNKQDSFLEKVREANYSSYALSEIYFLPELLGETKCKVIKLLDN